MQQRAKEYLARRNRRTITSQIRGVSSFSLSSRIYFSIRNDTATFSTRISHQDSETTGYCKAERRNFSHLFSPPRAFSTPRSFLVLAWPPPSFSSPASKIRHEVSSTLLRLAPISWDLSTSRPLHLTCHRRAGTSASAGELRRNVSRKSTIHPPAPTDWYDFIGPPRFIGAVALYMIDLRRLCGFTAVTHPCSFAVVLAPSKGQNVGYFPENCVL